MVVIRSLIIANAQYGFPTVSDAHADRNHALPISFFSWASFIGGSRASRVLDAHPAGDPIVHGAAVLLMYAALQLIE